MAKNIRKNKRLTKRRMNSSKKRLTKRRMNLSKRKSRIKVSKKRLTKKRLTTKRGGSTVTKGARRRAARHGTASSARSSARKEVDEEEQEQRKQGQWEQGQREKQWRAAEALRMQRRDATVQQASGLLIDAGKMTKAGRGADSMRRRATRGERTASDLLNTQLNREGRAMSEDKRLTSLTATPAATGLRLGPLPPPVSAEGLDVAARRKAAAASQALVDAQARASHSGPVPQADLEQFSGATSFASRYGKEGDEEETYPLMGRDDTATQGLPVAQGRMDRIKAFFNAIRAAATSKNHNPLVVSHLTKTSAPDIQAELATGIGEIQMPGSSGFANRRPPTVSDTDLQATMDAINGALFAYGDLVYDASYGSNSKSNRVPVVLIFNGPRKIKKFIKAVMEEYPVTDSETNWTNMTKDVWQKQIKLYKELLFSNAKYIPDI